MPRAKRIRVGPARSAGADRVVAPWWLGWLAPRPFAARAVESARPTRSGRTDETSRFQMLVTRWTRDTAPPGDRTAGSSVYPRRYPWQAQEHSREEPEVDVDGVQVDLDRKSTRLNSSHVEISYAV